MPRFVSVIPTQPRRTLECSSAESAWNWAAHIVSNCATEYRR